jgi:hypothetical protein
VRAPDGREPPPPELVQVFADEFLAHVGTPCPLPRDLPFHKIVDWEPGEQGFRYDPVYADKEPDWTFRP